MKKITLSKYIAVILIIITPIIGYATALDFDVQRWKTANGVQIVFYQTKDIPMLDIDIAFAAGSAYDGDNYGLSALTTRLMSQGSGHLNATQVATSFAEVGSQFDATITRDMALFHVRTLTESRALMQSIATLALIINQPSFRYDAFQHEKNQLMMANLQAEESPDELAENKFFATLYANHPYGHAIYGTKE